MYCLKNISLCNFRCYSQKSEEFSDGINIIYGENAVGKTSLLEAVSFLCLGMSFKRSKSKEIIKSDEDYFFVSGQFVSDDAQKEDVVVSFSKGEKKIKKNNSYTRTSDYYGYINVISFSPDDLTLVKGGPKERRNFVDMYLSQRNKAYLYNISLYNKVLKTRNEYLKNNLQYDNAYLDSLDEMLSSYASKIIDDREYFIAKINSLVEKISLELTNDQENIKLTYSPDVEALNVHKKMKESREKDFIYKTTIVGPHKDDIKIAINGKDANAYGSQGQIRTVVIVLLLALNYYFKETNDRIIILLDDVFSELDLNRQNSLLKFLKGEPQIFITTTDVDGIDKNIIQSSKLIRIAKGG